MKSKTELTLSIVIPVYNEERYMKACLDAIYKQTDMPDEVIVVDNNCTDKTIEIAKTYPFVKIIKERRQSQVFAQKTGFDLCKTDIFGRLDADSIIPPHWVVEVKKFFLANPEVKAITGSSAPYDICFKWLAKTVFRLYNGIASLVAGSRMMWGANYAIRRESWRGISSKVLQQPNVWEDFDVALLLGKKDAVKIDDRMEIGSSFRAVHRPLRAQLIYQFRPIRTFYYRKSLMHAVVLAVLWTSMAVFYPLVLIDQYILKPLTGFKEPY